MALFFVGALAGMVAGVLFYRFLIVKQVADAARPVKILRPGCPHPEDKRVDASTMGHRAWYCKECGHYEEVK